MAMDPISEDDIFAIKKILDKRVMPSGKIQYLIKRANSTEAHNSWEPAENVKNPLLIKRYQRRAMKKVGRNMRAMKQVPQKVCKIKISLEQDCRITGRFSFKVEDAKKKSSKDESIKNREVIGFERGLVAERIIETRFTDGKIVYEMKWKGDDTPNLVYADEANVKCPQVVIENFEKNIHWAD